VANAGRVRACYSGLFWSLDFRKGDETRNGVLHKVRTVSVVLMEEGNRVWNAIWDIGIGRNAQEVRIHRDAVGEHGPPSVSRDKKVGIVDGRDGRTLADDVVLGDNVLNAHHDALNLLVVGHHLDDLDVVFIVLG